MKYLAALILLACGCAAVAATDPQLQQVRSLRLAGDYQAAILTARYALVDDGENQSLLNELGELQFETGQMQQAQNNFRQLAQQPTATRLTAMMNLAEIHRLAGDLDAAADLYREIRTHDRPGLSARELYAIAGATRRLGRSEPQLFQQAVQLYDRASREDPGFVDAAIALGELLLEKYNNEEALQLFAEVLQKNEQQPRALLGLAKSQHFDYSSKAMLTALRALELNPGLVAARVFVARLFIELEQYDDAMLEVQQALTVNPVSLEALSMLAAVHLLQGDMTEFAEVERRVLALNPRYAELYTALAELAAQNRLYREARDFASTAVALDAQSWRGHGLLGINQLRLGQMQPGRASLERSFAGDPYNVWIRNTLQLADSLDDYLQIERPGFLVVLHRDEQALLGEYIHELTQRAYRYFATRYRHEPGEPIRVELYPQHADFSVRTVGLAGVGLLGVSFGPVVAMDSPAARARGEFNWGSTLWHELAHVFHLSISANRVPRWFSEGLSVYEERLARPGWGGDVSPEFLLAYLDGRLLPLSQLNNGFVRPSYPEQVMHSYFQASLAFEFIESRWGFDVIRDTLYAYRHSSKPESELLQRLQLDAAALDAAFDAYLQTRYAGALEALRADPEQAQAPEVSAQEATRDTQLPDKYFDQLRFGGLLLELGNLELAELFLQRAQKLLPEYAGGDSSYWLLASIYQRLDLPEQAEQQLAAMIAINADHYEAHTQLAKLRAQRGDQAGAAAALAAAIYIFPYEVALHEDLARHLLDQGDWAGVARERRALLALDPVDRAEAHYQLAFAYERGGDRSSAREQILYALEIAPNFLRAQQMLLSLRAAQTGAEAQQ